LAVIGALRRGSLWESTAVAEIREQVRTVSDVAVRNNWTESPHRTVSTAKIFNRLRTGVVRRQKRLAIWAACVGTFSLLLVLQSIFPSLHQVFEGIVGPHSPWTMLAMF